MKLEKVNVEDLVASMPRCSHCNSLDIGRQHARPLGQQGWWWACYICLHRWFVREEVSDE